ncbi:phage holin family protein [Thioalkalivibrio sp. XN279]|uniref:phage holin family protein n=1 Tax=Thioalkalivibrio sp. XN279 TaxID=2714953 RepID=UPI00140C948A|nr:hypothetical protein [Thioalkalivibrio sp. XN279]
MATHDASAPPPDFGQHAASLASEVRGLVHDHIELATLESRLFIVRVSRMGMIAVFSGLVLASAWLALAGAAALVLIDRGMAPPMAMTLLALANLVLGLGAWLLLRATGARLGWPATQRTIRPPPPCQ